MKKILLATTALVAFAGAASAEVALSGTGIISVIGGSSIGNYDDTKGTFSDDGARFLSRADVGFTMSGETDGGLAYGAYIELDEAALTADNNETVWVSGAFGKFTIGDTDSAIDWANAEAIQGANLTDEYTIHAGALANFMDEEVDNTIARYEYAMGDFAVAASIEISADEDRDTGWSVGATYNMAFAGGSVKFGAGYQDVPDFDGWPNGSFGTPVKGAGKLLNAVFSEFDTPVDASVAAVSAKVSMDNGMSAVLSYASLDFGTEGDGDQYGIGAEYKTGALTVGASYGKIEVENEDAVESYAVGAAYDLGGGATLFGGAVSEKWGDLERSEKYQAGIILKF